ncbi:MAG: site-2 protease family protein [Thermoprotei archaeon]|nr:MAG: site-2 protease family protein [Thermoprotei archaeon]RLF22960.1 MAG: site-2 protease family protein [Thermoprotei archaeon]
MRYGRYYGFTLREVLELAVSWIVISFCFSAYYLHSGFFSLMFSASLIGVGLGFVLHELMHRFTAQRFGCLAEYRMWVWGLMLALIMALASGGRVIFAAPGAVYITPFAISTSISVKQVERVYGVISLAGPGANIMLAALFYGLMHVNMGFYLYVTASMGFTANLWLAAFNLIPVPPLDGYKVFKWSPLVWSAFTIPVWALLVLTQVL